MGKVGGGTGAEFQRNEGSGPDVSASVLSENGTGSVRSARDKWPLALSRFGTLRYAVSAAVVLILGVAGIVAWYWRGLAPMRPIGGTAFTTQTASAPATALSEDLSARLASVMPKLDEKSRMAAAREYESEGLHKAEAASLEPVGTWRSSYRPTSEIAQEFALEDCQIYYDQPCILLVTDNEVEPTPRDGKWRQHDMPRVRYNGSYDPQQIPGAAPAMRDRSDVLAYGSASGPKAAAFHLVAGQGSRLFITTNAASQRAAEEEALEQCNNDPIQGNRRTPCFLYAVGNKVVLPSRFQEPVPPGADR